MKTVFMQVLDVKQVRAKRPYGGYAESYARNNKIAYEVIG